MVQKKFARDTDPEDESEDAQLERAKAKERERNGRLRAYSTEQEQRVAAKSEQQIAKLKKMAYEERMQYLNDLNDEERSLIEAHMLVCDDAAFFIQPMSPADKSAVAQRLDALSPESHRRLLIDEITGSDRVRVVASLSDDHLEEVMSDMGPVNQAKIVNSMEAQRKRTFLSKLKTEDAKKLKPFL